MEPGTGARDRGYFRSRLGATAFGLASLAVGIGLLSGVATGSTALLIGVLLATLGLVAISLYVVFRREGVLTAENRVIGVFVLLSLAVFVGLDGYTSLPPVIVIGAVVAVGVLVPTVLVNHTDLGDG